MLDSTPLRPNVVNTSNNSVLQNAVFHSDRSINDEQHVCGDSYRSAPAPYLPHIKPDTYDGSSNFEQYMSHFEDCAELSRWDGRIKVLTLASGLRGSAQSTRACHGCNAVDHLWTNCPRNMNRRPSARPYINTQPRRYDNTRDTYNATPPQSQYRPTACGARAAVPEN